MARKKQSLSTVVALMSEDRQAEIGDKTQEAPATTLPIDSILPDPDQPRRLLPDDLAGAVASGELSPFDAVQTWLQRGEIGEAALRHNVQELRRLADSIALHGLINPISVREPRPGEAVPPGIEYLTVTGERRYWAHVLLAIEGRQIHEGEQVSPPARIKVTIAPPGVTVRAHQLIENLLREDINAVERAQGLWALRYELSGIKYPGEVHHGAPLPSADEVHHGAPLPPASEAPALVPWARVEETLGIKKRYRIYTTSVLGLCQEAQEIIRKHGLTERTIRPIVQKLKERPDLQVKALKQLIAWLQENEEEDRRGSITLSVKELVERLLAGDKPTRRVSSAPIVRFGGQVRRTLDFLGRLKKEDMTELSQALSRDEFAEVAIDLRNLRQQIDKLLEATAATSQETDSWAPPVDRQTNDTE